MNNIEILQGNYQLLHKLGQGGMGEVYKAMDLETNKTIAIKRLLEKDETSKKRFLREYKFLKAVRHPNLVESYDCFEEKDQLFMVLEFVPGISLKECMEQKLEFPQKLAVANKAARGVEVLNRGGIIHRDIKPANIMVNKQSGVVKILDLGVAKSITDASVALTAENALLGTIAYMSPEQADANISEKSDVFSLGVTFYQLFAGLENSPFESGNMYETVHMIGNYHPPDLYSQANTSGWPEQKKHIYREISDAISLAMAKKVEDRKINAGKMADLFAKQAQHIPHVSMSVSMALEASFLKMLKQIKAEEKAQQSPKKSKIAKKTSPLKKEKNLLVFVLGTIVIAIAMVLFWPKNAKESHLKSLVVYVANKKQQKQLTFAINEKVYFYITGKINIITPKDRYIIKINGHGIKSEEFVIKEQNFSYFQALSLTNIGETYTVKVEVHLGKKIYKKNIDFKVKITNFTFLRENSYSAGGQSHTVPEYYHDKTGMEFALIPGGIFMMGSMEYKDGQPVHKVRVDSFFMSKTEVTQKVWLKIMGTTPWRGKKYSKHVKEGNSYPAVYVSRKDCLDFCKKVQLHLPTEAQWEYACRAGTTTRYYWGNNIDTDYLWYKGNSWGIGEKYAHKVGLKKPNAFGLFDMSGNVWEWCRDWHGDYSFEYQINPIGPLTGSKRIERGGSCFSKADNVTSAKRFLGKPTHRRGVLGFRLLGHLPR